VRIMPSILAGDLAAVGGELRAMEQAGCDAVHWDVMDGHFVPNLTFGVPVIRAARPHTALPFDVHLMVTDPAEYVPHLQGLGLSYLSFQVETTHFAPRLCTLIRDSGMLPSVVLNPQTPLTVLDELLELVDNVLLMSVDPGFFGQEFIERTYSRIERLATMRAARGLKFLLQVDGGVSADNVGRLAALGVDHVVVGKAYFSAADKADFVQLVHAAGSRLA
jgi:ribulose-phosphate 3-epimerase